MKKNLRPFGRTVQAAELEAQKKREKWEKEQATEEERRIAFLKRIRGLFTQLKKDPEFIRWVNNPWAQGLNKHIVLSRTDYYYDDGPEEFLSRATNFYLIFNLRYGVYVSEEYHEEYARECSSNRYEGLMQLGSGSWDCLESPLVKITTAEQLAQFLL